jgi:uncharacterized protein YndB with AHSA1/START domain
MRIVMAVIASLLIASPASARVVSADAHTMVIEQSTNVAAPHAAAWATLLQIGQWWSKDHTYSGNSANLSLDPRPGGCFCERFSGGGGIEHMRVTLVQPGDRILLTGALGPLVTEGVTGALDIEVKTAGAGSKVIMRFKAAGFAAGNGAELAPLVDKVLGQQLQSLARRAAGPR